MFRTLYQTMQTSAKQLQRLQQVSDVLRRTFHFTTLVKQLQTQMAELGDGADRGRRTIQNTHEQYDSRRMKCDARARVGKRTRVLTRAGRGHYCGAW